MNEPTKIEPQYYVDYLKFNYKGSPRTILQYARCFKNYCSISDVIDQESFYNFFKKYSVTVQNRAFLKSLLICYNIKTVIQIPTTKARKQQNLIRYFTKAEIHHIIDNCSNNRIKTAVALAWDTGLRLSEIINIDIKDIDFDKKTINGFGKGNKEFKQKFSDNTLNLLIAYLDECGLEKPFQKATVLNKAKEFHLTFRKEMKKLGTMNAHFHMVRHGVGRHLRRDLKIDLEVVRAILRHKDISTTQRYAESNDQEVEDTMDMMFSKD